MKSPFIWFGSYSSVTSGEFLNRIKLRGTMPDKKKKIEKKKSMLQSMIRLIGFSNTAEKLDPEEKKKKKENLSSRAKALRAAMGAK